MTAPVTAPVLAEALDELRARTPLVQCLTNTVVTGWTANLLLAVGAAPAMVDNPAEAGLFAAVADGVLINLGTPYGETVAAMRTAAAAARAAGTPWVLDPVAAGGLPWRTKVALALVDDSPTVIRGNASEILALVGGAGGRGVETTDAPEAVIRPARELASANGMVIAISGPVDHLTDGERVVRIANGHPWAHQGDRRRLRTRRAHGRVRRGHPGPPRRGVRSNRAAHRCRGIGRGPHGRPGLLRHRASGRSEQHHRRRSCRPGPAHLRWPDPALPQLTGRCTWSPTRHGVAGLACRPLSPRRSEVG